MKPEDIDEELEFLAKHFGVEKPTWDRVKKSPITWYSKKRTEKMGEHGTWTETDRKAVRAHCHIDENEIVFHAQPTKPLLYHEFMHILQGERHQGEETKTKENCPFCNGYPLEEVKCEKCGGVFKTRISSMDTCFDCRGD